MTMRQFYDWQTAGGGGDVSLLIETLERRQIQWCMVGGLAVNHWAAEPMATADVDVVVALDRVEQAVAALTEAGFTARHFEWSVNLQGHSQVSVQISTAEFYRDFPARAVAAEVHGIPMRVACVRDTLRGKLAAYADKQQRSSKRQKDLLDIARLIESHPHLRAEVPPEILQKFAEWNVGRLPAEPVGAPPD
jgi:hypothetical protein